MQQINRSESHAILHSFCVKPKVKFETQLPNEEVILVLRAHPITQLPWILNGLLLFFLLFFLSFFFSSALSTTQSIFLNFLILVFILSYFWFNFLAYFFNVGIITNMRIIDMDYHAIIYKEFSEAKLNRVEDITAKSSGYFASLFNFGDVFVQTAGAAENLEFLKVSKPTDAVSIINSLTQV